MTLKQTSTCPRCGAAIFVSEEDLAAGNPQPKYFCTCPRPGAEESAPRPGKLLLD